MGSLGVYIDKSVHPHSAPPKLSDFSDRHSHFFSFYFINSTLNCFEFWILLLKLIMPWYTKDDIAQAIKDVANGKSLSAAKEWGVPHSTLWDRIRGSEPHSLAAESQQRLSRVQEDHLANWVLTQEALGVPLTHAQIKEFA